METNKNVQPKITKLQIFAFWFIYSLHEQNIISPDIIIQILPLLNEDSISKFFVSQQSIKKKYYSFIENNTFPFRRTITQYSHSTVKHHLQIEN